MAQYTIEASVGWHKSEQSTLTSSKVRCYTFQIAPWYSNTSKRNGSDTVEAVEVSGDGDGNSAEYAAPSKLEQFGAEQNLECMISAEEYYHSQGTSKDTQNH